ncbi:MAG TPA: hypothetical protein VFT55_13400 [Planctomycetota bacterium]|nr:hypothetical protein [Planctomycetota bacterium]
MPVACVIWFALLVGSACKSDERARSIWPPSDLEILVEELELDGAEARVLRRFRAVVLESPAEPGPDGLAAYGTSSHSVVDPETRTLLPVFDRLSVYRLVPTSIRALARRLDRAGIAELEHIQGERGVEEGTGLAMTWQAFGRRHVLTARGRLHGPMAEIMALVAAHLPPGENFGLPGLAQRPVVPVLVGVPPPREGAAGALEAHERMLVERPEDQAWLLDAFALACHLSRRTSAEALLQRWSDATAPQRLANTFPDEEPRLRPEVLQRMLPAP